MNLLSLSVPRTRLGRAGVGAAVAAVSLGVAMIMTPGTALAATSAAQTPACAEHATPVCWGSIASGAKGQDFGVAQQFTTKAGAEQEAQNECVESGGVGCHVLLAYENAWGAMATNDNGVIVFGQEPGTSSGAEMAAESNVLNQCEITASGCRVAVISNAITGPGILP